MNYENLWNIWLGTRGEETPKGFQKVQEKEKYPMHWLTPELMTAVLRAFSPYDLYTKPDYTPVGLDYPSSAFNIQNLLKLGIPEAILQATQEPKSKFSMIQSMQKTAEEYPSKMQKYVPQAIYEHEVAHQKSPRLLEDYGNLGYLMRFGLPGEIATREEPAMRAEDLYWEILEALGLI